MVVPHHNLVKEKRLEFLRQISRQRLFTRTIIIIGPDHFSSNQNQISYSNSDWNLSNGTLKFNSGIRLGLSLDNSLLKDDHAIYNLLPDIKSVWPQATVYPVLIGQKVSPSRLEPLLTQVKSQCRFGCLLVASVDFSHYLPATLAQVHDAFTLDALQNHDYGSILQSEVDSPQSLYLLSRFSSNNLFHLFAHTNSGYIANNPDIETTTHIFGYYSEVPSLKSQIFTSTTIPLQTNLDPRILYGVDKTTTNNFLPNFVVSTIHTPTQTVKSFLPLSQNNFIRGSQKQQLIKNYFDSLSPAPPPTKDYFWGKLIYDH